MPTFYAPVPLVAMLVVACADPRPAPMPAAQEQVIAAPDSGSKGNGPAPPVDLSPLEIEIRARAAEVESQLIAWRRDLHEHPELGDQETRTSTLIAEHLRSLGLKVYTGVARTGVVGVLEGGQPGSTVALRADMDALPIKELTDLPFASQARGVFHGTEVDVMHACGHDAHTAMLMATATVLAGLRERLLGRVVFIFQPAEEGSSLFATGTGKSWGAKLMLEEGLFERDPPAAVFGLHVMPGRSGELRWRSGPTTASSDTLSIRVVGAQGHGGMPWNTVDPVVTSGLILAGLQTVVSRRANLTQSPAVVTIGSIHGGTGPNIVPEQVDMTGTIRTYDKEVQAGVGQDVMRSVENIAKSTGARAEVTVVQGYPMTVNDDALAARMTPVLKQAADGLIARAPLPGASEDFSYFAQQAPGLYIFLGVTPPDQDPAMAAPNHNPRFMVDEAALVVGTRAMASMAAAILTQPPP